MAIMIKYKKMRWNRLLECRMLDISSIKIRYYKKPLLLEVLDFFLAWLTFGGSFMRIVILCSTRFSYFTPGLCTFKTLKSQFMSFLFKITTQTQICSTAVGKSWIIGERAILAYTIFHTYTKSVDDKLTPPTSER